jgi:Zn-dependent peptidase ImmA (M78 family)
MAFILSKLIKKKLPEWNERVFTADDLDSLSQKMKVPFVVDATASAKGEYLIIDDEPMILLKPNLKANEKLWVSYHELGHHLLHYPVPHKFSKGLQRRMDREANFFAAIALMPTKLIAEKTFGEIVEEYGYSSELIAIRKEIYEAYKI